MKFNIRRGTNISHFLSQSEKRGRERREWFRREDVEKLAALGLDHLRLPVDEEQMWDTDGRREGEAWDLMNHVLDWAETAGLRVVVDLHIIRSHHFNRPNERTLFTDPRSAEKFGQLWADLSAGLRGRPVEKVAYELMNEPVADRHEDWNRVYPYPYRAIRSQEKDRTIVLGSNLWSQAITFDALAIPAGDPNMILTFHYYNPMHITHYKAGWVEECKVYEGPVQYPGLPIPEPEYRRLPPDVQAKVAKWNIPYDAAVMERDIAQPLAARARTGLPLWCSEFGVIHHTPAALRVAWYRDFIGVLDKHGIAWANWDYKGGFGMYDAQGRPTPVLEGLLGRPVR